MKFICNKYPSLTVCGVKDMQFSHGKYETEDKKEIEILKRIADVSFEDVEEVKAVEEVDKKPKK